MTTDVIEINALQLKTHETDDQQRMSLIAEVASFEGEREGYKRDIRKLHRNLTELRAECDELKAKPPKVVYRRDPQLVTGLEEARLTIARQDEEIRKLRNAPALAKYRGQRAAFVWPTRVMQVKAVA